MAGKPMGRGVAPMVMVMAMVGVLQDSSMVMGKVLVGF